MQHCDRKRSRMIGKQLSSAIFKSYARIIDLVDKKNAFARKLLFRFFDPLDFSGILHWLIVHIIVDHAYGQNGFAEIGTENARRDESA
jgi:hypothetical protein